MGVKLNASHGVAVRGRRRGRGDRAAALAHVAQSQRAIGRGGEDSVLAVAAHRPDRAVVRWDTQQAVAGLEVKLLEEPVVAAGEGVPCAAAASTLTRRTSGSCADLATAVRAAALGLASSSTLAAMMTDPRTGHPQISR